MNEERILIERRKKFLGVISKNRFVMTFSVLALASIFGAIISLLNLISIEPVVLLMLGLAFVASAVLSYFEKFRLNIYPVLAWIVWAGVRIRTLNLSGLKDITTGTWTLGPDLDPFLFLRWAEYIVSHGSIMAIDTMRYVPLGFATKGELLLTPYFIAWIYKIGSLFGVFDSVTHAAVIYPVIMFALTIIVFFFLTRAIFYKSLGKDYANIVASISSFFLAVFPSLLPRTIAGIPEKEAGAFLFMFLAFYLFIKAFDAEKKIKSYGLMVGAGISTAVMALIWGGYTFIFLTITPAMIVAFLLGKVEKRETLLYGTWLISSFALMYPFSTRYNLKELVTSIDTGFATGVFVLFLIHIAIFNTGLKDRFVKGLLKRMPRQFVSIIIAILAVTVCSSILFGLNFIPSKINAVVVNLVTPSDNRLLLTVAENKQPYFTEWAGSFGPYLGNIPVTFWLFFVGSILLFFIATNHFKKRDRLVLTSSYLIFLIALIFSRYSPSSIFNGTNFISVAVYALGFIIFSASAVYYIYQYNNKQEHDQLKETQFGMILLFIFFLLSVVAARAAVRTIMVLDPSAAILVAFILVIFIRKALSMRDPSLNWFSGISLILLVLVAFSGYTLYNQIEQTSTSYVPSIYQYQWQKAMSWVRDNTPKDAVFGHWWDYGYWIQSIGQRATVLDGGNAISYWNHLMGRYALTGKDSSEALEFLYSHNATYFLIDSSDIGKYGAFASIGSDVDYDRLSVMSTFYEDNQQSVETKNSTSRVYVGGVGLDEDLEYEINGTKIFVPKENSGIRALIIDKNSEGRIISPPKEVIIYNNKQYILPMRYAYQDGVEYDFGQGIDAGVFIYPRVLQSTQGLQIDRYGALIYLSGRTVHSQLTRLYLFGEKDNNFNLAHSEDDLIVSEIKSQSQNFNSDFVDYAGFRGPIKIWKIDYPANVTFNPEFLKTEYPEELIRA